MRRNWWVVLVVTTLACGRVGTDRRDEHGMTALMRAARDDDRVEAARLISAGADVNARVPRRDMREFIAFLSWMQQLPESDIGYTPLHYAAKGKHTAVAELLIQKGATQVEAWRAGLSPMDISIFASDLATLRVLTSRGEKPGPKQIWLAVSSAQPEIVDHLIRSGADLQGSPPPFAGSRPRPPLAVEAAKRGDPVVLKLLLDAGVDANARDENGWTPLRHAKNIAEGGRGGPRGDRMVEVIALLEQRGVTDSGGARAAALFKAVRARDPNTVALALQGGANPNARDDAGSTALVWAAHQGDSGVVAALIAGGAHVNLKPQHRTTPLIAAIEGGNVAVVRQLLDAGARPDLADHIKLTPLEVASNHGNLAAVELLLAKGAPIGPKVLPHATLSGNVALVRLLVSKGANVNADSGQVLNEAARGCSRRRDNTEIIRALLEAGANPNLYRDMSPLHRAAGLCPTEATRLLLAAGANPDARSIGGSTPIFLAAFDGNLEVVELLIAAKANVNLRDDDGKTALQQAARHPAVQAALRRAGAR